MTNAFLVHRNSRRRGNRIAVPNGQYWIGRDRESDLRLPGDSVHPRHCRLTHQAGKIFIEDAGCKSPTLVNGKAISAGEKVVLGHQDELQIGAWQFLIAIPKSRSPKPRSPSPVIGGEISETTRNILNELESLASGLVIDRPEEAAG